MENIFKSAIKAIINKTMSGSPAYQYQNTRNSGKSISNLFKGA